MKNICKILIVDDDTDDREILRDAFMSLENSNHQYEFLESGDALLQYLEEFKTSLPDLIMLDLNMPGKGGRETLKEIKSSELYHHIPTVVFTTSSSKKDAQTCYSIGANCFVTKPDTFNKLVELTSCIQSLWLQQY